MVRRIILVFFTILFLVILGVSGVLFITFRGPSETARDQLALSMIESSALKFVPRLFMSNETVDAIILNNSVVETTALTDVSLVSVTTYSPSAQLAEENGLGDIFDDYEDEWADYPDGIRVENIRGGTYRGYMMLVRDPSRVFAATSSDFKGDAPGMRINEAMNKEGAVAAINGGGFPDDGGVGSGNVPIGIVISKGVHLWGGLNTVYSGVMGFDENDILIVGSMSPAQAIEMGIRDAINFGPVLVVNGEPAEIRGVGSGLNPRSAIGQRSDGTVLILCIDGRMPSSMGANIQDLINIMMEYGAVNAGNLDGGTSSHLMYMGEFVNVGSSLYGARRIPTYFMVRPADDAEGL